MMTFGASTTPSKIIPIPDSPHYCLADDGAISRFCLENGRLDWDQRFLDIPALADVLTEGALVIDVGAFIGDTTHLFVKRGCKVVAIEPQADAFEVLKLNCPDATCIDRAAGERGQLAVLTDEVSNTDANNLGARQVALDAKGSPVLVLDDLELDRCELIKIDAEGFEPFVLRGSERLIQRTRPVLFVEVNLPALRSQGFTDHRAIYDLIEAWGYGIDVPLLPERVGTEWPWDIVCTPAK